MTIDTLIDEPTQVFDWLGPYQRVGKHTVAQAFRNGEWCHVTRGGNPLYSRRFSGVNAFAWAGRRYLARAIDGFVEFHITLDGNPAYDERFDQVGDFAETALGQFVAQAKVRGESFYITDDGRRA